MKYSNKNCIQCKTSILNDNTRDGKYCFDCDTYYYYEDAEVREEPKQPKYRPLLRSWAYYFLAVFITYMGYKIMLFLDLAGVIDSTKNKSWMLVLFGVYFACGIFLNIKIMNKLMYEQQLEYHQFTNTISNIIRDKISFMMWWIFKYPSLLIKLALITRF